MTTPQHPGPASAAGRYVSPQCAEHRCADCRQAEAHPPEPQHGIAFDPCSHFCHTAWPAPEGDR
ncbi:hypothetical protein [Streptomyces hoynatensis]|uniref:Uncharacterized protein n=1 Tax=Streptomyces hoynatensis TaxID=1141874 RepID=A0A3A9Z2N2_9ACTN|nr:hypothetical protein [Streptomyces hoynatensis]RKN42420.1 hypothetical protein D7294_13505 [Streptomyces hoynatensis]